MPIFDWLKGDGSLAEVEEAFLGMLADDRQVFDLAVRARLHGESPERIAGQLNETEERTDEAERRIRRLVLIHASVRGASDIPACLMYMSITKDAERIADLSKNIFGIATTVGAPPQGDLRDDLLGLAAQISPMITEAADIFARDDADAAQGFIVRARDLQEHCREQIESLLLDRAEVPQIAATVLTYRHLSRIVANLLNVVSAVVVPLDQLDYPAGHESD